jgi:hypothetical protein
VDHPGTLVIGEVVRLRALLTDAQVPAAPREAAK